MSDSDSENEMDCALLIDLLDECEPEEGQARWADFSHDICAQSHPSANRMHAEKPPAAAASEAVGEGEEALGHEDMAVADIGDGHGALLHGANGIFMHEAGRIRLVAGSKEAPDQRLPCDLVVELCDGGVLLPLTRHALEELGGFELQSRLTFADPFLLRNYPLWSMAQEAVHRLEPCDASLPAWRGLVAQAWVAPVFLQQTTAAGLGLHAAAALPAWSFVGEYTGLVHEEDPSAKNMEDSYRIWYPAVAEVRQISVTARHGGSLMRFANHSVSHANMRIVILDGDDGWFHLLLVTCKEVSKGQQLLFNYGPQYWQGKDQPLSLGGV